VAKLQGLHARRLSTARELAVTAGQGTGVSGILRGLLPPLVGTLPSPYGLVPTTFFALPCGPVLPVGMRPPQDAIGTRQAQGVA
jgi:hypothetical protein